MRRHKYIRVVILGILMVGSLAVHTMAQTLVQAVTWIPAGPLGLARESSAWVSLPNGTVLVVGGASRGQPTATAEVFDPIVGGWQSVASLTTMRMHHTATFLPAIQRVLVVGGADGTGGPAGRPAALGQCESHGPGGLTWTSAGSLNEARAEHTATLLPDGSILVIGGVDAGRVLATVERYFPSSGQWFIVGSLGNARRGHTAVLLNNAQVLVTGGLDQADSPLAATEVFDLATMMSMPVGPLGTARSGHTSTLLQQQRVLVVGGRDASGVVLRSAEIYNPSTLSWGPFPQLVTGRVVHQATVLPSGGILVTGGLDSSGNQVAQVERIEPPFNAWTPTASLRSPRSHHLAARLSAGRVLVAGGLVGGSTTASSEVFHDREEARTLIVLNSREMSERALPDNVDRLYGALCGFAAHEKVSGVFLDLADAGADLDCLYNVWGNNPEDVEAANAVLFGATDPNGPCSVGGGIIGAIEDALKDYPNIDSIQLVGGDLDIPMARLQDRTTLLSEKNYLEDLTEEACLGDGVAICAALEGKENNGKEVTYYLSDDPLAALGSPLVENGLDIFLPKMPIARLVETPDEIIKAIQAFLATDGELDLQAKANRVFASGYEFLEGVAWKSYESWNAALGSGVYGELIDDDWWVGDPNDRQLIPACLDAVDRVDCLRHHLSKPYAINLIYGHGSSFAEGVPSGDPTSATGLAAWDFDGAGPPGSLDLSGGIVIAVGCHSGLPVPGSSVNDRTVDMSQTYLSRGVLYFTGNTGYAYGSPLGDTYAEKLTDLFSQELLEGGRVRVGDVMTRAKVHYFQSGARFDVYDQKTLSQSVAFGFPMYTVDTGLPTQTARQTRGWSGAVYDLEENIVHREDRRGAVIDRTLLSVSAEFSTVEMKLDFSNPDLFEKRDSHGRSVSPGVVGCLDPKGCYYTLQGTSSDLSDAPVMPAFVADTGVLGKQQKGILFKGATFVEEQGWTTSFAEVTSNFDNENNYDLNLAVAPLTIYIPPRAAAAGGGGRLRKNAKSEPVWTGSAVISAGEALRDPNGEYPVVRRHKVVELEVFYLDATNSVTDQTGPTIEPGYSDAYHQAAGSLVAWAVKATDIPSGVARVTVTYTDNIVDNGTGCGTWQSMDLARGEGDIFRGSMTLPSSGTPSSSERAAQALTTLSFLIQAVDAVGNVSVLMDPADRIPTSGMLTKLPLIENVPLIGAESTILGNSVRAPSMVDPGGDICYTLTVQNLGPGRALEVLISHQLPSGSGLLAAGTDGSCVEAGGGAECQMDALEPGTSWILDICTTAPVSSGIFSLQTTVDGLNAPVVVVDTDVSVAAPIFADGFESGDLSNWTTTLP